MTARHPFLIPDHLQIRLRQLGLNEEFILWQHATDFLRNRFNTHIIPYPIAWNDSNGQLVTTYDCMIICPYGEGFEKDGTFTDYYETLEDGIVEALNDIEAGVPATDISPEEELKVELLKTL